MGRVMNNPRSPTQRRPQMAGGVFIALGGVIGPFVGGGFFGQPTMGFLGGLAGGALLALLIWVIDARK